VDATNKQQNGITEKLTGKRGHWVPSCRKRNVGPKPAPKKCPQLQGPSGPSKVQLQRGITSAPQKDQKVAERTIGGEIQAQEQNGTGGKRTQWCIETFRTTK